MKYINDNNLRWMNQRSDKLTAVKEQIFSNKVKVKKDKSIIW